ncbi:MAG: hypothetical protein K8S56_01155 [Candidatus Cloacimonetes bacterium]|nr:hypothetical protein [Candidatus Cloacimonadota bacterium]
MKSVFGQYTSLMRSIWMMLVVISIFLAAALPQNPWCIYSYGAFVLILLALPLVMEFKKKSELDEMQTHNTRLSSHIVYNLTVGLLIIIMMKDYYSQGENAPNQFYMLLLTPMTVKLLFNMFANLPAWQAARIITIFFGASWTLFAVLSHVGDIVVVIEATPFLLLIVLGLMTKKWPVICGLLLTLLGIFGTWFFIIGNRFDIYMKILMTSILILPVLTSGVMLLIRNGKKL